MCDLWCTASPCGRHFRRKLPFFFLLLSPWYFSLSSYTLRTHTHTYNIYYYYFIQLACTSVILTKRQTSHTEYSEKLKMLSFYKCKKEKFSIPRGTAPRWNLFSVYFFVHNAIYDTCQCTAPLLFSDRQKRIHREREILKSSKSKDVTSLLTTNCYFIFCQPHLLSSPLPPRRHDELDCIQLSKKREREAKSFSTFPLSICLPTTSFTFLCVAASQKKNKK